MTTISPPTRLLPVYPTMTTTSTNNGIKCWLQLRLILTTKTRVHLFLHPHLFVLFARCPHGPRCCRPLRPCSACGNGFHNVCMHGAEAVELCVKGVGIGIAAAESYCEKATKKKSREACTPVQLFDFKHALKIKFA